MIDEKKALAGVIRCLPNVETISRLEVFADGVQFEWAGEKWRVSDVFHVEQIRESLVENNTATRLMEALLRVDRERERLKHPDKV